jgi:hypothetical protein
MATVVCPWCWQENKVSGRYFWCSKCHCLLSPDPARMSLLKIIGGINSGNIRD